MNSRSRACGSCLQAQEKLCRLAKEGPAIVTCANGLMEAAVPVRLGNETIGFLQTGQVAGERAGAARLQRVSARLAARNVQVNPLLVRRLYAETPVVPRARIRAVLRLLSIFADSLSRRSNEIALQEANAEPPPIQMARQYIREHSSEKICLGEVAKAAQVGQFHLCKLFRKGTGMTFTEFVSRTRIEKARSLLMNPNVRVSEAAYEVGFRSLTHFNRVFREIMGQSPTEFRERLPGQRG